MANSPEQPDPIGEAQLEHLLKSSYADTPLSAEFQESLLRQLDQEFVRTYYPSQSIADVEDPVLNGKPADDLCRSPHSAVPSTATTAPGAPPMRKSSRPRRRIGLRLAMTLATAASMLFAVSLWNSQNAYGWASMLRALESCGWVQAVSESAGLSGWASSQRGIVAIRSADRVAFHDHNENSSSEYLSDRQVVYRQDLSKSAAIGPAQLFGLLLGDGEGGNAGQQSLTVISETWRELETRNGQAGNIELRVALRESGPRRRVYKVLALLDPKTHLPKSFRLLNTSRRATTNLTEPIVFKYPSDGPNSIFSLGIPSETVVVTSLIDLVSERDTTPREAVASRSLGQENNRFGKNESERVAATPENEPKAIEEKPIQAIQTPTIQVDELVIRDSKPSIQETSVPETERIASNPPRPAQTLLEVPLPKKPVDFAELVAQVSAQLAANWQAQGITPADPAGETEFLRRVYLDLTGRIPLPFEVYDYLENDAPDRRERLVDELLSSRDHATHLATVWRKLLLPEGVNLSTYGGTGKFDEWLADRFEKNVPYDELVRQLLLAEGRVSDSGPILFYAALKLNPEELAAKTARTFLGMRMECAQCHDHKFDESITQEDFWGFAAHFAQISRPKGKIEMTSSVLRVRDNNRGEVTLPDTDEIIPPQMPYQVKTDGSDSQQADSRSRREKLVDWLTTTQNSRFARATVNRAWQHLFGLGLVEPVDDMRDDNPAAHPEVLETLSLDFAANCYDLRRLLRALVLSDAYQLSSRAPIDEPSQALVFARMNIKSFSADQLYDCIFVATDPGGTNVGNMPDGALARFSNTPRQAFIEQFRAPPGQRTDYHAGIPQALTLMHGSLVHGATALESSGLLKSLNAPFMSDQQRVETLFLATLSRLPDEAEEVAMLAHLEAADDDEARSRALGDVLWALLNSAEFTFIH